MGGCVVLWVAMYFLLVSWHKMSVSLRCTAEINHDPDLLGAAPVSSFRRVIEVTGEGRMLYTSTSGRLPGK